LAQQFTTIGLALGGAAGVRLSRRNGFTVSRNTLLRLVRKMPLPLIDFLETLGVDDFAFRKCQTYGTILVDKRAKPTIGFTKGYIDTKGLFGEIQRRGYSGSYDTVARYTRRLRSSQGLKLRQRLVNKPLPGAFMFASRNTYHNTIRKFLTFTSVDAIALIQIRHVRDWLDFLQEADTTKVKHLNILKVFFSYVTLLW